MVVDIREHVRSSLETPSSKDIRVNNNALQEYLINGVYEKFQEKGSIPQRVPESLTHIMQVKVIGKNIVIASNISQAQKQAVLDDTERMALVHDIGRIDDITDAKYNGNLHPIRGEKRLSDMGFERKYVDFAIDHHQWGLGLPRVGAIHFEEVARTQGVPAAIAEYEKKYGLPGLVSVVADLSKAYLNPEEPHRPVIVPLSEQRAKALIERQVRIGNFDIGSPRYNTEILGVEFIIGIINHLQTTYGVDYQAAITNAQSEWDQSEQHNLDQLWKNKLPAKQLAA